MCDYSLHNLKSRPAAVGDRLITKDFGTGTRGFAAPEDHNTAVCVLPGTELAFDAEIDVYGGINQIKPHRMAIFRQVRKNQPNMHHDAIEFPDGSYAMLTYLIQGQHATVLQLPAAPKNEAEAEEQRRVEFVG